MNDTGSDNASDRRLGMMDDDDRAELRGRTWWVVAAAVLAVVVGGVWWAVGREEDRLVSVDGTAVTSVVTPAGTPVVTSNSTPRVTNSAPSTVASPAVTSSTTVVVPPTVVSSTVPDATAPESTIAVATPGESAPEPAIPGSTVISTTYPVTDQLVASCFDGLDGEAALGAFAVARANDRYVSQLGGCVAGPDQFSAATVAPACWEPCSQRTFRVDALAVAEYDALPQRWGVTIPVTYRVGGGLSDSAERWEAAAKPDGGYEFTLVSIDAALITRDEARALIDEYFAAVGRGDWNAVARFLDDGALESEARQDLQRLGITDYSPAGVATGLAEWCHRGCMDELPPDAALLPNGYTFEVMDGDEVIGVVWYEGYTSIRGLPFRLDP